MATLAANLRRADTPVAQSIRVLVALLGVLAGAQVFIYYVGAALLSEVFLRLLPIPLLLWLISRLILRGRAESQVFWVLAVLTSCVEPYLQDLLDVRPETLFLAITAFVPDYALNMGEAVFFR